MAAAQSAEYHGDEWGLTWCLQWGIYTSISTWTHSQNSQTAAKALSLDILPQNISKMITKTITISTRIVTSYAMKQRIPFWVWKVSGNWDNNMIRGKAIVEQILASEERKKSKRTGLWELRIQVGKLTIWVWSLEIKKLQQSSPGPSVPPE